MPQRFRRLRAVRNSSPTLCGKPAPPLTGAWPKRACTGKPTVLSTVPVQVSLLGPGADTTALTDWPPGSAVAPALPVGVRGGSMPGGRPKALLKSYVVHVGRSPGGRLELVM